MSRMFSTRARRVFAALGAAALVGAVALPPGGVPATAAGTGGFSKLVTAVRQHVGGPAETYKITITADRTSNLQDQQDVNVTWTGAPVTKHVQTDDPNGDAAADKEHPMVLLQCRGTAATVTPETCWAPLAAERLQREFQGSDTTDIGHFPAWRLDRYATDAERAQYVGLPDPLPANCKQDALAMRIVPFTAANGTKYYSSGTDVSCGPHPPDAPTSGTLNNQNTDMPDNAAFVTTAADHSGAYKFNVRDASTNASLGCSASVACAIVAIPIVGISCDPSLDDDDPAASDPNNPDVYWSADRPARAAAKCELNAQDGNSASDFAASVSGRYWWSASNWRNRVVIPIGFQRVSAACDATKSSPYAFFGSELVSRAAAQWRFRLCENGAASFKHVEAASEINARTQVGSGSTDAAFSSKAPDFPFVRPVVQAPVAATGFAIAYAIDNSATKKPVHNLRLTPRLLAKLITESYPTSQAVQDNYSVEIHYGNSTKTTFPLKDNPINLSADPEFKALNPGIAGVSQAADVLTLISKPSDIMYALTSYINADPEARAWLDGQPDPWGMVVNPNYRGISLPVNGWPLLDTWDAPGMSAAESPYGLYCFDQSSRPPYLSSMIAAPVQRLGSIADAVRFAHPYESACDGIFPVTGEQVPVGTKLVRRPVQPLGSRFILGLTSLGDAVHYDLDTAALQSTSSAPLPPAEFTTKGRSFVVPTDASLKAAFSTLSRDDSSGAWDVSYDKLRQTSGAYPGSMLVYADVASQGIPASDARAYAGMLRYMIGPGQVRGEELGQLPGGFLPLTAANGLGDLAACTLEAAQHVAAQDGELPCQPAQPEQPSTTPLPGSPTPSQPTDSGPSSDGSGTNDQNAGDSTPVGSTSTGAAGGANPSRVAGGQATAGGPTASSGGAAPSGSPSQAPGMQAVSKISGPDSSAFTIVAILALILLIAGPVGVPGVLLLRRWRAR